MRTSGSALAGSSWWDDANGLPSTGANGEIIVEIEEIAGGVRGAAH